MESQYLNTVLFLDLSVKWRNRRLKTLSRVEPNGAISFMDSLYTERTKTWEENGLARRNVCCSKLIQHRPLVKEQNSKGKNSFPVRSLMSYDSLAELRNPHSDRYIPFVYLQNNQKTSATRI